MAEETKGIPKLMYILLNNDFSDKTVRQISEETGYIEPYIYKVLGDIRREYGIEINVLRKRNRLTGVVSQNVPRPDPDMFKPGSINQKLVSGDFSHMDIHQMADYLGYTVSSVQNGIKDIYRTTRWIVPHARKRDKRKLGDD